MSHLHLQFSQPDLAADSEIKTISFLGLGVLVAVGVVGFQIHVTLRKAPRLRLCILGLMGAALWALPFLVLSWLGPRRSRMAHFTLSFFGVVAGFRWLELTLGTGPAGFDLSLKNFVVYFASPAEVLFDGAGKLRASKEGLVSELLFRIAKHMLLGTVVLSIGKATAFVPFLEPGTDPAMMPLLGFPVSLPAVYLQTLYIYCTLATAMLMHRLLLAFFGIDTVDAMQSPLILSVSIREFWGRRWNLVVHRLMKRTFFVPLAGASAWTRRSAGLLAFVMSGLFHEYMWLALHWHATDRYVPGLALLFFLAQFVLCAVEAVLASSTIGCAFAKMPDPVRTVCATLVILPFGPLFLQGLQTMALESTVQGQTFSIVQSGAGDMGTPPLDWIFCGVVGLLTSAHGALRKTSRTSVQPQKAAAVVAVLPEGQGA